MAQPLKTKKLPNTGKKAMADVGEMNDAPPVGDDTDMAVQEQAVDTEPTDMVDDDAPPEDDDMGEPLGAQVLRRMHDHVGILLEEYDQIMGVLENENVKSHLQGLLEDISAVAQDTEEMFLEEYPDLEPLVELADDADTDGDAETDGDGDMPASDGGSDDVDGDVATIPADSAPNEEPSGEDVVMGMETKALSKKAKKKVPKSGGEFWRVYQGAISEDYSPSQAAAMAHEATGKSLQQALREKYLPNSAAKGGSLKVPDSKPSPTDKTAMSRFRAGEPKAKPGKLGSKHLGATGVKMCKACSSELDPEMQTKGGACQCKDPNCPNCQGACTGIADSSVVNPEDPEGSVIGMCAGCAEDALANGFTGKDMQGEIGPDGEPGPQDATPVDNAVMANPQMGETDVYAAVGEDGMKCGEVLAKDAALALTAARKKFGDKVHVKHLGTCEFQPVKKFVNADSVALAGRFFKEFEMSPNANMDQRFKSAGWHKEMADLADKKRKDAGGWTTPQLKQLGQVAGYLKQLSGSDNLSKAQKDMAAQLAKELGLLGIKEMEDATEKEGDRDFAKAKDGDDMDADMKALEAQTKEQADGMSALLKTLADLNAKLK